MKKITLFIALLCSLSAFSTRYLVQGTAGTNTWRTANAGEVNVTTSDFRSWYYSTFPGGYTYNAADEIWLAGGTYILSYSFGTRKINVYGGFAGTETSIFQRIKVSGGKAWEFSSPTVLDGNNAIPQGFTTLSTPTTPTTYIDGVTIKRCQVTNVLAHVFGVGAYITQGCVMQNCIVSNNTYNNNNNNAYVGNGGGIYLTGGQVLDSYIANNQLIKGSGTGDPIGGGIAFAYTSELALNTVSGCTIENNFCTTFGGGIVIINGVGGTIENCIVKGNTCSHRGAGLGYTNIGTAGTSTLSIKNCQFIENTSSNYGGGVALNFINTTATTIFENNSIIGNTGVNAGGMYIGGGTFSPIKNCIFRDNKCTDTSSANASGALYCNVANMIIQNCVFANNSSAANANKNCTVRLLQATNKLYNCTFVNNSDVGAAGYTLDLGSQTHTVKNNVFWGNNAIANLININTAIISNYNATTSDKNTTGSVGGGTTGNITTLTISPNNTFVSPTTFVGVPSTSDGGVQKAASATADWNLKSGCPSINTGIDLAASSVTTDILGNTRPTGAGTVDMGAYEYGFNTAQTITFGTLSAKTYGDATSTLSATGGGSGNPVVFTSSNTNVATCTGTNGATLTVVGAGVCTIYANQASGSTYSAAIQVGQSLTVNAKILTLTTPAAANKTYDGTNAAAVSGTLSGIINSDAVTCTTGGFAPFIVGNLIPINCILSGIKATNYTLTQPGITANITAKALTIGTATIASKVYNRTTSSGTVTSGTLSGFIGSETVTVSTTVGTYPDANVGTGKTATIVYTLANGTNGGLATNYSLAIGSATGNITAKALTMSGLSVPASKTYDGLTTAVVTDAKTLQASEAAGTGTSSDGKPYTSDVVSITGTPVGTTYNSKDVASASTVTYSGLSLTGAQAGNYSLTIQGTSSATITAAPLTITGLFGVNKVYDGTTTASLSGTPAYSGLVNSEVFSVTGTPSANFADDAVGNGKSITVTGYSAPTGNYTVSQPTSLTADITSASINISSNQTESALTSSTADVTVSGVGTILSIGTNKTVKSLTVAPGASVTIGNNVTLTATNGITIESDATGTATIIDGNTTPTITATIKQYVTAGRNWYVSTPVSNALFSQVTGGDSLVIFNESLKRWEKISADILIAGKGYIRAAINGRGTTGTVNFNGLINAGDITVGLTRTESGSSRGFNLVGNPYPSYLDWSLVAADPANTNIGSTMWFRTKNVGDVYTFATHNGTSGYTVTGTANTTITKFIPPMQAFWVRVNANGGNSTYSTSMTFKNTMRAHRDDNGNILKAPKQDERKCLRLQVSNGTIADETMVYYDANALNTFDNYDSPKIFNNSTSMPEIFTQTGNERLVINGMTELKYETEIPLGFSTLQANDFSISSTEMSNFELGTKLILKDKLVNTEAELGVGTAYNFSSEVSTPTIGRFSLILRSPSVTTDLNNTTKFSAQAFVNATNQITIIAPENTSFSVFNYLGQKQYANTLNTSRVSIDKIFSPGVYFVELLVNGQRRAQKVVIR